MTFLPTPKKIEYKEVKSIETIVLDAKVKERVSVAMFLPKHKRVYSIQECIKEQSAQIYEHVREKYQNFGKRLMRRAKRMLDELDTHYQKRDYTMPGSDIRNYVRSQYKIDV